MPAQDVSLTLVIPTPNEAMDGVYGTDSPTVGEWDITIAIYAELLTWNRRTKPEVEVRLEGLHYTIEDYNLMVMHFYRRGWVVSPVKDMYRRVTVKEASEGAW